MTPKTYKGLILPASITPQNTKLLTELGCFPQRLLFYMRLPITSLVELAVVGYLKRYKRYILIIDYISQVRKRWID